MCIVFYTTSHPGYRLILASNRDEYLDRPTIPASWHSFEPISLASSSKSATTEKPINSNSLDGWVLSGRDSGKEVGGTWLGITRDLRIGVVTNIRHPYPSKPVHTLPSRGDLLKQFLSSPPGGNSSSSFNTPNHGTAASSSSRDSGPHPAPVPVPTVHEYLQSHVSSASDYDGFNLLLFKINLSTLSSSYTPPNLGSSPRTEIGYLTNRPMPTYLDLSSDIGLSDRPNGIEIAKSGTCGLSNTPIDKPWPKVINGQRRMAEALDIWEKSREEEGEKGLVGRMLGVLSQSNPITSLADTTQTTLLPPVLVGTGPQAEKPLPQPDDPFDRSEEALEMSKLGRWYGTRISTVILIRDDGGVVFVEKDISGLDNLGRVVRGVDERWFEFQGEN